jgi:hypothetical protein
VGLSLFLKISLPFSGKLLSAVKGVKRVGVIALILIFFPVETLRSCALE